MVVPERFSERWRQVCLWWSRRCSRISPTTRAVAATGAGIAVFDADVARLRSGIEGVLGDHDAFSKRAKVVAGEMAEMRSLDQAAFKMLEAVT